MRQKLIFMISVLMAMVTNTFAFTVTLGENGTLIEDQGKLIGTISQVKTISNATVETLGVTITTTADMGSTNVSMTHSPVSVPSSIQRVYTITPVNNSGLNATLTMSYLDSELNGLNEANLIFIKSNDGGTTWSIQKGTVVDTTNNTLTLSGIDGFSTWTAAENFEITSYDSNTSKDVSIKEQSASVATLSVTPFYENDVVYSIDNVDDGALFSVNSVGEVTFITPPSYISGGDNNYDVTVVATAFDFNDTQTFNITVISDNTVRDSDGDGLSDSDELNTSKYNTDPYLSDTDGDGVNDGQEIALGTDPNNKPPIITQSTLVSVNMDMNGTFNAPELNATDADGGDTLTWSLLVAPNNGNAVVNGTGANPATFTYTPTTNWSGTDYLTIQVSDGKDTDSISVKIVVSPVTNNDADTAGATFIPYSVGGTPVYDYEGNKDPSSGGTGVSPENIDIASCSQDGVLPGTKPSAMIGYFDVDNDYSTTDDAKLALRMRLNVNPSSEKQIGLLGYHWDYLVDIGNDGEFDYIIDVDGKESANKEDKVYLYADTNHNKIADDGELLAIYDAYGIGAKDEQKALSATKISVDDSTLCGKSYDYWLDVYIPVDDFSTPGKTYNANTQIGLFYSTSASATDPLQKDWMGVMDGKADSFTGVGGGTIAPTAGIVTFTIFDDLDGNKLYDNIIDTDLNANAQIIDEYGNVLYSGTSPISEVEPGNYRIRNIYDGNYGTITKNITVVSGETSDILLPVNSLNQVVVKVYEDLDGDGVYDTNEPAFNGSNILLDGDSKGIIQSNGTLSFALYVSGAHTITHNSWTDGYIPTSATNVAINHVPGTNHVVQFGLVKSGEISGVVYHDKTGDGALNNGESGLSGVTIILEDENGEIDRTTTDANGVYRFDDNISINTKYYVIEEDPSEYASTSSNTVGVSFGAGSSAIANFGDVPEGVLSGYVFSDDNGNGKMEDEEQRLPYVTITIINDYDEDVLIDTIWYEPGAIIASLKTGNEGNYSIALPVGKYRVIETDPLGYVSDDNIRNVVLPSAQSVVNFADTKKGVLTGKVFNDLNGNGVYDDGEPGMNAVTVKINNNTPITLTNAEGEYYFGGLVDGSYTVDVVVPDGFVATSAKQLSATISDTAINGELLFGIKLSGMISGTVYNDINGNGKQDLGENGLGGATITLSGAADATTTTIVNGSYFFNDLTVNNDYVVTQSDLTNYISTTPNVVSINLDSNGEANASASFGDLFQGVVYGIVFEDINGNGEQDSGELPITGVNFSLDGGTAIQSDAKGLFNFYKVSGGEHSIDIVVPNDYFLTTSNDPQTFNMDSYDGSIFKFGVRAGGTVVAYVYNDDNKNGIKDSEESIYSLGVDVTISSTKTTDENGTVSFYNIAPGDVNVTLSAITGYDITTTNPVEITALSSGDTQIAYFGVYHNTAPWLVEDTYSINENSANGVAIGLVSAGDDNGDDVNISIISGNDGNVFILNDDNDTLYVAGNLDYETTNEYTLTIQVTDGELTSEGNITIIVADLNEAPTVTSNALLAADEDSQYSYTLSGSDEDGNNLTWSVADGTTLPSWLELNVTSSWTPVGSEGFSGGEADYVNITFDNANVPYIVYEDYSNGNKATVMRYNGSSWEIVGSAGISDGSVAYTSIAIDSNNIPYIAYSDELLGTGYKQLTVMKYNGSSWEVVGTKKFTSSTAEYTSIAIDANDIPYVAFKDGTLNRATVMRYNSSAWEFVGSDSFSQGGVENISIVFDSNNNPHVVYTDTTYGSKAVVMKFNGSSWESLGDNRGFTSSTGRSPSLAFDSTDMPYVVFRDGDNANEATVMKYNGSAWEFVGNAGFSSSGLDYYSIAIDSSDVIYVVYQNMSWKAVAMKYSGTSWELMGGDYASEKSAYYTSVIIDSNDIPYLVYKDWNQNGKISLFKYSETMQLTGTPTNDDLGIDDTKNFDVNLTLSDGTNDVAYNFTIEVTNTNDAPTLGVINTYNLDEEFTTFDINLSVDDMDGDNLVFKVETNQTGVNDIITFASTNTNAISYSTYSGGYLFPTISAIANRYGSVEVTVTVEDTSGEKALRSFVINVANVDDAPIAYSMAAIVGPESTNTFDKFTPNFTDYDGVYWPGMPFHNPNGDYPVLLWMTQPSVGTFEKTEDNGSTWIEITDSNFTVPMNLMDKYRFNAGANSGLSADVNWSVATSYDGTVDHALWSNITSGVVTIIADSDNNAPDVNISTANDSNISEDTITINEDNKTEPIYITFSDDYTPSKFLVGVVRSSDNSKVSFNDGDFNITRISDNNVSVVITPRPNAYGDVNITLGAFDGNKEGNQTFTLHITSVNDLPTNYDIARTILEDNNHTFNELYYHMADEYYSDLNDSIQDSNEARPDYITFTTLPAHGIIYLNNIQISQNQNITMADILNLKYVPEENNNSDVGFKWKAFDGTAWTDEKDFIIHITAVNDAPTLDEISDINKTEDDAIFDVSLNSNDVEGDSITYSVVSSNNAIATASIVDGKVRVTPITNKYGLVTITVTASTPDAQTSIQSFDLNISSDNDAPTASNITFAIDEDNNLEFSESNFTAVYSDVEDSSLYSIFITSLESNGSLELNGNPVSIDQEILASDIDTLVFIPIANGNGTPFATFGFKVNDGEDNSTSEYIATINVRAINDIPTINSTALTTVAENDPYSYTVVVNNVDANETLTYSTSSLPTWLSFNESNQTLSGTSDINGTFDVNITVSDGDLNDTQSFTINVTNVNDAPVLDDKGFVISEDTSVGTIIGTLKAIDEDDTEFTYAKLSSDGDNTFEINATSGEIKLIKVLNAYIKERYTLQVSAKDDDMAEDNATVIITISNENDTPVGNDDNATFAEDTNATINLLVNDTDKDNNIVSSSVIIIKKPLHGTVEINGSGYAYYVPNENYNGSDIFTYKVYDATSLETNETNVSIIITSVNDAPIANDTMLYTNEDIEIDINFTKYASDVDGDALEFVITQNPSHGNLDDKENGIMVYDPDLNFYGYDTFKFKAIDGNGSESNEATIYINLAEVNDIPIANEDNVSLGEDTTTNIDVIANDTDDGDINNVNVRLTLQVLEQPKYGTVSKELNGTFTYTPEANWYGNDSFTYNFEDDGLITSAGGNIGKLISNTGTVNITVNSVNDTPVANDDNATMDEDKVLLINLHSNDTDIDNSLIGSNINIISNPNDGNVTVASNGLVRYIPNKDFNGNDSFTYTISDGEANSSEATVSIIVNPINDAPKIDTIADVNTSEDAEGTEISVIAHDIDSNSLRYSATATGNLVRLLWDENKLKVTPIVNKSGIATVTVIVKDNDDANDTQSFDVNISSVNDAPYFIGDSKVYINENITGVIYSAQAGDIENDTVTFSLNSGVEDNDLFTITNNGDISFKNTPDYETPLDGDANNVYIVNISASDIYNANVVKQISIYVNNLYEDDGTSDTDGDGIPDSQEGNATADDDNDGIPNYQDNDSDNDGITDDKDLDYDNDGILDSIEKTAFLSDVDNDGIPNFRDLDSDGDGKLDSLEGIADDDLDGIPNYLDNDDSGSAEPRDNNDGTSTITKKKTAGSGGDVTTEVTYPNGTPLDCPTVDEDNNTVITFYDPSIELNITKDGGLDINTDQDEGTHNIKVDNPGADFNLSYDGDIFITTPIVINPDGTTCQYKLQIKYLGDEMITKHILGNTGGDDILSTVVMRIPDSSIYVTSDNIVNHFGSYLNEISNKETNVTATVNCLGYVETRTQVQDENMTYIATNKPGSTVIVEKVGDVSVETAENTTAIDDQAKTFKFEVDGADGTVRITKTTATGETQITDHDAGKNLILDEDDTILELTLAYTEDNNEPYFVRDGVVDFSMDIDMDLLSSNFEDLGGDSSANPQRKITIDDNTSIIVEISPSNAKHEVTTGSKKTVATSTIKGSVVKPTLSGVSTIFEDNTNNLRIDVEADNTGKAVHKFTLGGLVTKATSNIIGAQTLIDKDLSGNPKIVTAVTTTNEDNQSLSIQIDANNDGSAIHLVTLNDTTITKATSKIAGAQTTVKTTGAVETNASINTSTTAIVVALPDGKAIHEVKGSDFDSIATSNILGATTIIDENGTITTDVNNTLSSGYANIAVVTNANGETSVKIITFDNSDVQQDLFEMFNDSRSFPKDNNITIDKDDSTGIIQINTIIPLTDDVRF